VTLLALTSFGRADYALCVRLTLYSAEMRRFPQSASTTTGKRFIFLFLGLVVCALRLRAQDSADEGTLRRADRPEISVTVRDSSGTVISAPATVTLIGSNGAPAGQSVTDHGRAFFVVTGLGEYELIVQAAGYKVTQKEVSVLAAVRIETDVYVTRDSFIPAGAPGTPVLAPKAKEFFDKAVQALRDNKLHEAEKYIGEALKLAPGHPGVLYLRGVLLLREGQHRDAQTVFEKVTQLDPNHAPALAALGMALSNQDKYDAAIPPLEKCLQIDPKTGYEARWALAKSYYHHGQYEQALEMAQAAMTEANGKSPEIELLVAQSFTAVGRYEDSAQALRHFLKNHSDDAQAAMAKRWLARLAADGKIHSQ
jgi:Tfp pilus assembly protein PilF